MKYRQIDVVQDVCQRWGYTVHALNKEEEANLEIHEDFFTMRYAKVMPYRIFQKQTTDGVSYEILIKKRF